MWNEAFLFIFGRDLKSNSLMYCITEYMEGTWVGYTVFGAYTYWTD